MMIVTELWRNSVNEFYSIVRNWEMSAKTAVEGSYFTILFHFQFDDNWKDFEEINE